MAEIFGYTAALVIGFSLGLIGGGGSILTVPVLVYLMGIDPVHASGYSLFIVGITSLVGSTFYFKKNEVNLRAGLFFSIPSFLGVYFSRAYVIPQLPPIIFSMEGFQLLKPGLIMLVFSILMLTASLFMIRGRQSEQVQSGIEPNANGRFSILIVGFGVGTVAGFVGAGGGFLIIPALIFLVQMSMRCAIGTSLMVIAIQSLLGFAVDLKNQESMNWQLLLIFALIAVSGLFFGIRISKKISDNDLKKIFGYFVMILGTFILYDQIRKM